MEKYNLRLNDDKTVIIVPGTQTRNRNTLWNLFLVETMLFLFPPIAKNLGAILESCLTREDQILINGFGSGDEF